MMQLQDQTCATVRLANIALTSPRLVSSIVVVTCTVTPAASVVGIGLVKVTGLDVIGDLVGGSVGGGVSPSTKAAHTARLL